MALEERVRRMTPRHWAVARLLVLMSMGLLLVMQHPLATGALVDPDIEVENGGRPMPRPDSPGAANRFRQLQWNNELGTFPDNGLVEGRRHADQMRARGRLGMFPRRERVARASRTSPGS